MNPIPFAKWAFNERCNLRCPYCLADNDKVHELSFPDLCKVMDKLHALGVEYIDFFGKEPLLNDTMFSLIDYADSKGYCFRYTFITNGKNVRKYTKEIIECGFSSFTISYDGGYGGREFIFDLKDLEPFIEEDIPVGFSVDVHRNNVDHLENICSELISGGASSLYFKPIIPHVKSASKSADDFYLAQDEYLDCVRRIVDKFEGFPLKFSFPFVFNKVAKEALVLESETTSIFTDFKCDSGNGTIFIASNGDAYGCGVTYYDNRGNHCINFLSASDSELELLKSDGTRRLCVV